MKKKLLLLVVGFVALAILVSVQIYQRSRQNESVSTEEYIGQESRITRAEVARMLSLLIYTREELESMERIIAYEDTEPAKWYDKYINGMSVMGLVEDEGAKENRYHPMAYFTYGECKDLVFRICAQKKMEADDTQLGQAGVVEENLLSLLSELQGNKQSEDQISPREWLSIYEVLWKDIYKAELEETAVYIIETWENTDKLEKWQTLTNEGIFYGDGLNFVQYLDKKYQAITKGNEILCLKEKQEEPAQIRNVWLLNKNEKKLKVFINGCTRELNMAGNIEEDIAGQVGDLYMENGQITKVSIKPDRIYGRVLVANDSYLEIENYGKKALSKDYCVYRTYDGVAMEKNSAIVVGYENAEFVIVGDEICAALITKPVAVDKIRVLLKTNGFKDYYHPSITITSDSKFTVAFGETTKSYGAKKKITMNPDSTWFTSGRVRIKSEKEDGKLTITSIERNGITPSYEGVLEISKEDEGLLLVNELSLEHYLYGVIPSEMPISYGVEALKAQAVCARSYAYKQLMANGLRKYGAHVDDSSSYQVYNNIPTSADAIKAAEETKGQVLQYDGDIITAYYFSTSCGYTADANQVWNGTQVVEYLEGSLQVVKGEEESGKKVGDLSQEDNFKDFITEDICKTYDSDSPWYRWSVTISREKLKKSIEENLEKRYLVNHDLILSKTENGEFESKPLKSIGEVEDIQVCTRQQGGIITELIIVGTEETIKVKSEYNIRLLLAPMNSSIKRKDGSKVESLGMLPSGFFIISPKQKDGKVTGFTFQGGGYGHGVGMSQNGAKAMVDTGIGYEEVLQHYYPGIQIGKIY